MPAWALQELLNACSAQRHEELRRAVCDLCQQKDAIRQQVVDMGGLLPLVNMLTSSHLPASLREAAARATFDSSTSNETLYHLLAASGLLDDQLWSSSTICQQNAALAIFCICNRQPALSQQMARTGALDRLMVLLSFPVTVCQEQTLQVAVSCICNYDPQSRQKLDSRDIQLLISLLESPSDRCNEHALKAVANLCSAEPRPNADDVHWRLRLVVELGGLQPLTHFLSDASVIHQELAVTAIANISKISQDARQQIIGLNGLHPLIKLLRSPSATCKQQAVCTLADICISELEARQLILGLDGLQPLIDNLPTLPSGYCCEQALQAIAAVCRSGYEAKQQILVEEWRGLSPLLSLLNSPSATCQEHAIRAIADICCPNHAALYQLAAPERLQLLICLLTSASVTCQEQALRPLADICFRSMDSRRDIVGLDGLVPLTSLLDSSSAFCQEHAVKAIAGICITSLEARYRLSERGPLQQLISLLSHASAACQTYAVTVLADVSRINHHGARQTMLSLNCLVPLLRLLTAASAACKKLAAEVVAGICVSHPAARRQIVRAGWTSPTGPVPIINRLHHDAGQWVCSVNYRSGLWPLVQLLSSSSGACRQQAVRALAYICSTEASARQELQVMGVVGTLMELLAVPTADEHEELCQQLALRVLTDMCSTESAAR